MMDLERLKQAGGLVSDELAKKQGRWERVDGEVFEFEFFVRRASYGEVRKLGITPSGLVGEALMIAACIRLGDDGSEQLTYDQAYNLDPALASVFLNAIGEEHGPKS